MAYNRYSGNSGRVVRVEEPADITRREPARNAAPPQEERPENRPNREDSRQPREHAPQGREHRPSGDAHRNESDENRKSPLFSLEGITEGIQGGISGLLSKFTKDMETEDLLLIMILYLLYRETGDDEFLFTLGAMLFL